VDGDNLQNQGGAQVAAGQVAGAAGGVQAAAPVAQPVVVAAEATVASPGTGAAVSAEQVAAAPEVPVASPAQVAATAANVTAPIAEAPVAATPAVQAGVAAPTPAPSEAAAPTEAPATNPAGDLDQKLKQLQESILSANIPQLVMIAISYALDLRSSDIHIEPLQNHVRVRYRIDGVLRHIVEYPQNLHPAVVSRVKIMSNLKIDEQRLPQDGRADVTTKEGKEMDLRISTLPTVNGEKIVMRIQDKSRKIPDLQELGISGTSLQNLEEALKSPNGIIINTGPTGSGKTTTLYSCLTQLNKVDVNILTIEDPVEIQLDGLNQSQVHHDIDFDFASGMRAALRQDPDIIMVGEIRDKETGTTAIEAALTGHLVFSTLHTNSAVESITRIINMGIQPYLISSTIELIIAQRLVRKICDKCKAEAEMTPEIKELVEKAVEGLPETEVDPALKTGLKFYEGKGCDECDGIGYHGRLGLYEVFRMTNKLRRLINEEASTLDIQTAAQEAGMLTLEQAGVIKALEGETTLEEVYRVARKSE
jgi:type II secretory ATPase GspE/PulE/Tfp pilus assembly ATPase PilB-like protein